MSRPTQGVVLGFSLVLSSCGAPPKPAPQWADDLRALSAAVSELETQVDTRSQAPHTLRGSPRPAVSSSRTGGASGVRPAALPEAISRFAVVTPGLVRIHPDELEELTVRARSIAALDAGGAAHLILHYGETRSGLVQAVKLLHLMQPSIRGRVLDRLRPAEVRAVLDQQVEIDGAPRGSDEPAERPEPIREPAPTPAADRRAVGRFVVAGHGQGGWTTVLDTTTGIVYNYREDIDGKSRWVPITHSLLEKDHPTTVRK